MVNPEASRAGTARPPRWLRRRWFLAKRAKRLLRRRSAWKVWRKSSQVVPPGEEVRLYRYGSVTPARATNRYTMPEVLCFDENTDETTRYLGEMRALILQGAVEARTSRRRFARIPVIDGWFDFGTMKRIGVSAALVLAALYDRQKVIARYRLSTIDEHLWEPEVRAVLHAVGFHELLEMQHRERPASDAGDFRILRFRSGAQADGRAAGAIQSALAELLPDDESKKLLYVEPYGGILEAILNSHAWAYPPDTAWEFPAVKRWWMTGAVDLAQNVVEVIVYDQGVSIPVTLPKWKHWSELEARLQRLAQRAGFTGPPDDPRNDAAAIALATKIARSSTDLPQHGKGLHTMFQVAQRARQGRLRILSRYGEYVWETGQRTIIRPLPHPLAGTLIHWTLEL